MIMIRILWLLLVSQNAFAEPAHYRGAGGQLEAFGRISGSYIFTLSYLEACHEFPYFSEEAEQTSRKYLHANQYEFTTLKKRIFELAVKHGGTKELNDLQGVLTDAVATAKKNHPTMLKEISENHSCEQTLKNIRMGLFDLNTLRAAEIQLIRR